jgi:hypothetical protein
MTEPLAAVLAELARAGHRVVVVTIDEVEVPGIRGLLTFRLAGDVLKAPRPHRRRYATQMNPAPLTGIHAHADGGGG